MRMAMVVLTMALCAPLWAAPGKTPPMANTGAHGDLRMALNGHALVARLTLPAEQVVGFAGAPSGEADKLAVTNALKRLGKADNVLVPLPEARCTVTREEAYSSLAPPQSAATTARSPAPDDTDFHGRYAWHCEQPDALLAVDVPLLEFMNGMALDSLVITGEGRRDLTLQAPQTRLPVVKTR